MLRVSAFPDVTCAGCSTASRGDAGRTGASAASHFARRLLDDTDLTVTQIAFAAGFGSLRQFNRACVEVFRASPTALRARRRKSDRLVADGGLIMRLPFSGPLDWSALITQLAVHAIPGVEIVADVAYRRTILVDGLPGVIELEPGGDDHVLLRAHLPRWRGLVHVVRRARRIASLDFDVSSAKTALDEDPVVGPLLRERPGVRPPGAWDSFEVAIYAIAAQYAPDSAGEIVGRLVKQHGERVGGLSQLGLRYLFPSPAALAKAEPEPIRMFSAAVEYGRVVLDRSVELETLVSSITDVRGIDERTAQYIALRVGERDAFPLELEGSDAWRPWRALAAAHLLCDSSAGR